MKRYSQRHNLTTLNEMNITPLLDLAFVLLVIFMITTPLVEHSLDLVVPTSATATTSVDPGKVQTISIDKDNVWKLNEQLVSASELEVKLAELKQENPDLGVVVRPHRELAIQKFIAVMDVLQKAKIAKVGVVTQEPEGSTD